MIIILVVLASTICNTASYGHDEPGQGLRQRKPIRSRVTKRIKLDVIELYASGLSALDVAERLGLGKSTVLRILKVEGVQVRPRGIRLS